MNTSNRKNQETLSHTETMSPAFSLIARVRVSVLSKKGFKARSRAKPERVIKRLKRELEEQKDMIREGQRRVIEILDAIESECEELKRETRFITQQSGRTKIKLALMFSILKARESGDLDSAANLTQMLREILGREQEEKMVSDGCKLDRNF